MLNYYYYALLLLSIHYKYNITNDLTASTCRILKRRRGRTVNLKTNHSCTCCIIHIWSWFMSCSLDINIQLMCGRFASITPIIYTLVSRNFSSFAFMSSLMWWNIFGNLSNTSSAFSNFVSISKYTYHINNVNKMKWPTSNLSLY